MKVECSICNKDFANKNSLYQHRNKYHKSMDKNLNEEKVLVPKRSHSNDSSEESDSDKNSRVKRIKTKKFSNGESSDEIVQKLVRVVAKLIKEVNQIHTTFGKVARDIDKAEDKIDENERNIGREITFKEMNGGGIDMEMKRFYQKIMDENSNIIKDIKETKKILTLFNNINFSKNI